jgi:hypothetical protein
MAVYYPHKQTALIALICISAVSSTLTYVYTQKPPVKPDSNTTAASPDISSSQNTLATNDDWKKQFFGGSLGTPGTVLSKKTASSSPEDLTLTDELSRTLFSRFIQLKQNNLDSNQTLMAGAVDETLSSTVEKARKPKQYSLSDIKTTNELTDSAYHQYGNSVSSVLSANMPRGNAPTIVSKAFDGNNMALLSGITPLISGYQTTIKGLLALRVPQPLAQFHLDLINSISSFMFVSQGLQNIQKDPMQSIVSLGGFETAQDSMKNSLLTLKNYFLASKVTFAPTEPGSLFATVTP